MTTACPPVPSTAPYDAAAVRAEFPIFAARPGGRALHYLDSAATAQKPQAVLDAMARFYVEANANIHRGAYGLGAEASARYEGARGKVAAFIGAESEREIVFTRGTTESINLVAQSWGRANLTAGDEILVTAMEHHANLVPWQLVAQATGARVVAADITDRGELDLDDLRRKLTPRTRIVAVAHISNVLGTVVPVADVARLAHAAGALVLVDGAQSAAHRCVDVQALGADFFVFSGHKLGGPTGIGVLWGCGDLLDAMPPFLGGGGMIETVEIGRSTYAQVPAKFEAGTPPIAEAVGLGAAVDWLGRTGLERIAAHEMAMLADATERLSAIDGVRLVGTAPHKASVLAFAMDGTHPHDIATILDEGGVAIRAGHHCAQPLHARFGLHATARASMGPYTTTDDIDALVRGLERVKAIFG